MQKLLKLLTTALFLTGLSLVGYSVYQIWQGNQAVADSTKKAKEMVKQAEVGEPEQIDREQIQQLSFQQNEAIGILEIPKLQKELPIVEGTDPDNLEKGVGHYLGTGFPLQNEQIVLSGHRDTVFRQFEDLEVGDTFIVKMEYGIFEYEIYEIDIVPAEDTTVIGSIHEENLTVTTCYPFRYLGNAPDRAIFYAKPLFDSPFF